DVPVIKVPGNHDIPLYRVWERFTAPHELYRKYISEELDTVTRMDGLTIVALDSSAPRMAVTNGRISPEQIEYCARAFAHTEENDLRVVVAHHHLAPAP